MVLDLMLLMLLMLMLLQQWRRLKTRHGMRIQVSQSTTSAASAA